MENINWLTAMTNYPHEGIVSAKPDVNQSCTKKQIELSIFLRRLRKRTREDAGEDFFIFFKKRSVPIATFMDVHGQENCFQARRG